MSGIKFHVEENVTKYLDTIYKNYEDAMPYHLKDLARVLTGGGAGSTVGGTKGSIGVRMADWNPNLYLSGQEEERWLIEKSSKGHSITVNYTGMTYKKRYHEDEFKVWWEFSEEIYHAGSTSAIRYIQYRMDPEDRTLARDYALYQETTYDGVADPRNARHPHAIREGAKEGTPTIEKKAAEYLENIMKLK